MLKTNITKIAWFVILVAASAGLLSACASGEGAKAQDANGFQAPLRVGTLRSPELNEASGIAASKCQTNVYWTHNDSGDDAYLFAINGSGEHLGTWRVTSARNRDWEDIETFKDSSGKCFVIIGDIGNNELKREQLSVYRVEEPIVDDDARSTTKATSRETAAAVLLAFRYPDARRNAETLLVHPGTGVLYVLTKSKKDPVIVYKLNPDYSGNEQIAAKVAEFSVPAVPNGFLTGGDVSPDGKRVVLCDYVYGYELSLSALSGDFDDIWKQQPRRFDLGDRAVGEAVAYVPAGEAVIAISEDVNSPVFLVERK